MGLLSLIVVTGLQIAFILRVLLRPHRQPASRVAWVVVIVTFPLFGIVIYYLLGETSLGRKYTQQARHILNKYSLVPISKISALDRKITIDETYRALFETANSITPVGVTTGNRGQLYSASNSTIEAMVKDIDAAQIHVHILFYIWLTDNNGTKIADAVVRAARRGVACRVMVDGLGSRKLIQSPLWKRMNDGGVKLEIFNPIGMLMRRG
ncbi:MAG: PLDc N-terminal domain-containing protein, partial [Bdellovibrionales bacterium]|nr:PLDc N-terminal domain-containing protein [Bdellovibrionales bacterium]